MIAGLEPPSSGKVFFNGEDETSVKVQDRDVGFMFQSYALFKHMTVAKNVAYGLNTAKRRKTLTEVKFCPWCGLWLNSLWSEMLRNLMVPFFRMLENLRVDLGLWVCPLWYCVCFRFACCLTIASVLVRLLPALPALPSYPSILWKFLYRRIERKLNRSSHFLEKGKFSNCSSVFVEKSWLISVHMKLFPLICAESWEGFDRLSGMPWQKFNKVF